MFTLLHMESLGVKFKIGLNLPKSVKVLSSELNIFFCQSQQCITNTVPHSLHYQMIYYINRQMFSLIMTNNSMTNHCSPHCLVIGGILVVYEVLHVQLYDACTSIAHEKIMCSQWTTLFFSTLFPPPLGDFILLVSKPKWRSINSHRDTK